MKAFLDKLIAAGPRLWGLLLGCPVVTAFAIYQVEKFYRPVPLQFIGKQIDYQGWALILTIALLGIFATALAAAKVSIKGPGGTGFDADASEDHS